MNSSREASDPAVDVNTRGPQHYKTNNSSIQHWDFVSEFLAGRYLEGNISKYVMRYPHKGQPVSDVEKAIHYLDKLVELARANKVSSMCVPVEKALYTRRIQGTCATLAEGYGFCRGSWEYVVLIDLCTWTCVSDLLKIRSILAELRTHAEFRSAVKDPVDPTPVGYVDQDREPGPDKHVPVLNKSVTISLGHEATVTLNSGVPARVLCEVVEDLSKRISV